MSGVTFEFDKASLDRLRDKLSQEQMAEALSLAARGVVAAGLRAAQETTPNAGQGVTPATGYAESRTLAEVDPGAGRYVVAARYPYARWLDTGKDSRGRVMKSRPGGYQIKRQTMARAKVEAKKAIGVAIRQILGGG